MKDSGFRSEGRGWKVEDGEWRIDARGLRLEDREQMALLGCSRNSNCSSLNAES